MYITETTISRPGNLTKHCAEAAEDICLHLNHDELILLTVALEAFHMENCEPHLDFLNFDYGRKLVTPKKIAAFVKTLSELTHHQTYC